MYNDLFLVPKLLTLLCGLLSVTLSSYSPYLTVGWHLTFIVFVACFFLLFCLALFPNLWLNNNFNLICCHKKVLLKYLMYEEKN